jgi:solute carrier family 15 oligopeptide transporter 1
LENLQKDENLEGVQPKFKYPRSVFFIIVTEFCERFNYYGIHAILILYLSEELLYKKEVATTIYHAFVMSLYLFGIFGAIIADSWWGRFKTIIVLSIVYSVGSILLALGGVPHLQAREWTIIGLLVTAIGSGGIKPNVSAFGGEQFKLPEQIKHLDNFFSVFYFVINLGSMISS